MAARTVAVAAALAVLLIFAASSATVAMAGRPTPTTSLDEVRIYTRSPRPHLVLLVHHGWMHVRSDR